MKKGRKRSTEAQAGKLQDNPGNLQQGRQQGQNTGQEAWKSNIKRASRNDPGIPKRSGPERTEREETT